MSGPAAATLVLVAVLVAMPGPGVMRRRLGGTPADRRGIRIRRRRWPLLAGGSAALVAVGAFGNVGPSLVLVVAIAVGAALMGRALVLQVRDRRQRAARRSGVIALLDAVTTELRAGATAGTALARGCAVVPELGEVMAAAHLGGDVAESLRRCATRPGADGLRAVAAAWDVASDSGAGLAEVLDRLAVSLRHDEDARAEVQAMLGPPRSTARMLALLPLFGLALGSSIGAHPVAFLLGSPWGLGCLAAGVLLAAIGVWWVEWLARSAEG